MDTLAGVTNFSSGVDELLADFQAYAEAQDYHDRGPATLYDPVRYAMGTRGKGVRPLLLLLTHRLGLRSVEEALPAAYALELFHTFTLLHDDIMDAAELRRGKPSVHVAYGTPSAILAGDTMLIHTYGYLLENYPADISAALLAEFQSMAIELCEGQQRDMDMEGGLQATYDDYLTMIGGKTGGLMVTAMTMGAQLGKLGDDSIHAVREAAKLAGRAFQIQDDILDTFSTTAQTGKSDYGDIVRGKQSAPYVRALELANPQQAGELQQLYSQAPAAREQQLEHILGIYRNLGVEKELSAEVQRMSEAASEQLASVEGDAKARDTLIAFTKRLASRTY